MTAIRALPGRLSRDARGVTVVEFAIVAPVMCLLLMGAFDLSHSLYTRAVLQGVVQKTARDSTLESAMTEEAQTAIDDNVRRQLSAMHNGATVTITRRFYRSAYDAAMMQHEPFTDTNHNDRCDAGEPYEDTNNNQVWDEDGGNGGQGGAKDTTVYTVTMSYPRIVPVAKFIGLSDRTEVSAQTVLRNQPYDDQGVYAPAEVRHCA